MAPKDPQAIAARKRKYYEANREAILASNRKYREANLEAILANRMANREATRAYMAAYNRKYYEANQEAILAQVREYQEVNREAIAAKTHDYYAANRDYLARQQAQRRQKLLREIEAPRQGQPWTATEDAIAARPDLLVIEVCYMLGRSYQAVGARRRHLKKMQAAVA